MRRQCIFFLCVLLMASCTQLYDDQPLRDRIDGMNERLEALEKKATSMNSDILAVRSFFLAAESGDVIRSCQPLEDGTGYRIVFAEAGEIVIHNGQDAEEGDWKDGQNGRTPVVGFSKDAEGRAIWTVDGEPLVDADGNYVYLTLNADSGEDGKVPQLRVVDGKWQVSYNGNLWTEIGESSSSATEEEIYWFEGVEQTDEYYIFTLRNSEKVMVPRLLPLCLTVSGYVDMVITAGMSASVDYTVQGATKKTKVYAVSNCGLSVSVKAEDISKGKIVFDASTDLVDGSVLVYADNGYGSMSMRMFVFKAGRPDITDVEGFDSLEDFDWGITKGEEKEEVPDEE